MTMWDFAAQYPDEFYGICLFGFLALMGVANSFSSAYKSKHEKGDDDSC